MSVKPLDPNLNDMADSDSRDGAFETYAAIDEKVVVVVDDEPAMLCIMEAALLSAGYRVIAATDGLSALDAASKSRVDLLVVDFLMPKMNGAETTHAIWKLCPGLPVLMVSGLPMEEVRAAAPPAVNFMQKPFEIWRFLERAQALVQEKQG